MTYRGVNAGGTRAYLDARDLQVLDALDDIPAARYIAVAAVSLAWLRAQATVVARYVPELGRVFRQSPRRTTRRDGIHSTTHEPLTVTNAMATFDRFRCDHPGSARGCLSLTQRIVERHHHREPADKADGGHIGRATTDGFGNQFLDHQDLSCLVPGSPTGPRWQYVGPSGPDDE